ncbi:MAG: ribosome maturation factor RimM [Acholeplasma sp.]|nr:ribosome maturation factor RimM [Acholeplasma sp.]
MYEIGKITTTHGIRGEVKVTSLSDFNRFVKNTKVFIMENDKRIDLTVMQVKSHKNSLIVKFKEFDNINEVLKFKDFIIYSDERGKLKSNEYYHDMLINLKVYSESNEYLGVVNNVLELPHGHLLEVIENDKKYLIPFVKEFIIKIDKQKIIIKIIEGLI